MEFAFCFYVGLTSVAFFGFVLYRQHVSERRTRSQINSVLEAIGGLREALANAVSSRPHASMTPALTSPLPRSTPTASSAPVEEAGADASESTRVPTIAVRVDIGGEILELEPEITDRLMEIAGSAAEIPSVLGQIIGKGTSIAERATGLASEDEDDEHTRVMGSHERAWRTMQLPEEPPAFPDLAGSEDETPRRRPGIFPASRLPAETDEPTVNEGERPIIPEDSGPLTPPKK